MDINELVNRFRQQTQFSRSQDKDDAINDIVSWFLDIVAELNDLTPDSREKSLAFTHLEEAAMWATQAIRRNGIS